MGLTGLVCRRRKERAHSCGILNGYHDNIGSQYICLHRLNSWLVLWTSFARGNIDIYSQFNKLAWFVTIWDSSTTMQGSISTLEHMSGAILIMLGDSSFPILHCNTNFFIFIYLSWRYTLVASSLGDYFCGAICRHWYSFGSSFGGWTQG